MFVVSLIYVMYIHMYIAYNIVYLYLQSTDIYKSHSRSFIREVGLLARPSSIIKRFDSHTTDVSLYPHIHRLRYNANRRRITDEGSGTMRFPIISDEYMSLCRSRCDVALSGYQSISVFYCVHMIPIDTAGMMIWSTDDDDD